MVDVGRVKKRMVEQMSDSEIKAVVGAVKSISDRDDQEQELLLEDIESKTESVVKIKPNAVGDPYQYEIKIKGRVLKIESKDLTTQRKFKQRYLEEFGKLIDFSSGRWKKLVEFWTNQEKVVVEDATSEDLVVEEIRRKIATCRLTQKREDALDDASLLYCVDTPKTAPTRFCYASKHIQKIISGSKIKMTLERARILLGEYLKDSSEAISVGGVNVRFWVFDPSEFQVDWKERWKEDENDD